MKNVCDDMIRIICQWVLMLAGCVFFTSMMPVEETKQEEINLLRMKLEKATSPQETIPVLSRLVKLTELDSMQGYYQYLRYEAARQIDSIPVIYSSLEGLANYHYNITRNRDSLLYWGQKVESLSRSRKEYPNALFCVRSLAFNDLLLRKNYELAMNDALDLYRLASEVRQTYGLVRCSETLGLIYRTLGRDSVAVDAFQEGIDLLDNYKPEEGSLGQLSQSEILDTQMRMTGLQLESCFRIEHFEKAERIAAKYKQLIEKQEKLNEMEGDVYPVKREYWLYYSLCADMYVRAGNMAKAKDVLAKAELYNGNLLISSDYVQLIYFYSLASYYQKSGKLPQALYYIDEILKEERLPSDLQLKAKILKEMGKREEVLELYDEIYSYDQSQNDETFLRQLNQLKSLHEKNEKEAQVREMLFNAGKMKQSQGALAALLTAIVLLTVLIYILYIYFRRARRLKDELQTDKETLIKSEEKLIWEKIKAEEASRMKSAFIANMSHEIRTPLNAIVGFSGLLVEEQLPAEEKEEYAQVIRNNTELLLNLVNDVLDLSRMETGDLNFKIEEYSLRECCGKALDSISHRVGQDVSLTFTPSLETVLIYTDALRLQQLLINLLSNAAKFTQKGEINLSYDMIDEGKNVRIVVTDTGCGIPLDKQSLIFKRFEKLDDYKPGTGLGLSISTLIAERLGGTLTIDPTYTNGARFVFIHPCERNGEAHNPETAETV